MKTTRVGGCVQRVTVWQLIGLLGAVLTTGDSVFGGEPPNANKPDGQVIFDGKTLDGWRVIKDLDFKRRGKVYVEDGVIYLERGKPATGISWKKDFPRSNYELTMKGQRVDGSDFFCGLTFPVKDEYVSLILGGWGGQVIGLSNIDGFSAVENETTQAHDFKQGQWYDIRLRVTDGRITFWLDEKKRIDLETKGHEFSIWWEQEPVTPLGIVTWHTSGAIKDLKLQLIDE
ncbi:MAG: hypothetical protein CMJ80_03900 [Planctomycetaceae bacterium]|nr:hypothetical protein [Planctomycetaceae bacterium]